MPHRRKRYLESNLKKLLGLSPIVGVLGHRQVGKTTILEQTAKHYYTMDLDSEYLEAKQDSMAYIKKRADTHIAIDECQTVEKLFPALKEWVRTHPKPGQFILSGSIRFGSMKSIKESLTGRIINLELFPMTISELEEESLPDFWPEILEKEFFSKQAKLPSYDYLKKTNLIRKYFEHGGLPGVCFIREKLFRDKKISAQLETILDQDLKKVIDTQVPLPYIKLLAQSLANTQGEPISWTELKKRTEISIPTIKKIFYGLEAVFLIRTLPLQGDIKGPIIFFEDQGEHHFLRNVQHSEQEQIIHFLYTHIRTQFHYRLISDFQMFQYRTRGRVHIPLVLQNRSGFLGIISVKDEEPSRSDFAQANSFLKMFNRSKIVFIHTKKRFETINDRICIVPLQATV